jgi:hypothetical protein
MIWQVFISAKGALSANEGFFRSKPKVFGGVAIFFEKKCFVVVAFTQRRFTFDPESNSRERIIWFYLVRAEVVLWWHCLIFFARMLASLPFLFLIQKSVPSRLGGTAPMCL